MQGHGPGALALARSRAVHPRSHDCGMRAPAFFFPSVSCQSPYPHLIHGSFRVWDHFGNACVRDDFCSVWSTRSRFTVFPLQPRGRCV
ncbi:hypothetical protein CSUI_008794 [Cystoisospora suis]|uniref:Uncharacterized protein n=1 Tax=Cystoisospora suis TaxID=483139 RepID=A0A2C6KLS8_9APIC|nr:hypothetical protein CSUI_008794 [Cystoisospora suis]